MQFGGLLNGFQQFGQSGIGQGLANNAGLLMSMGGQLMNHYYNPRQPMFDPQSTFVGMTWDKQRKKDIEDRENDTLTDQFLINKFGFTKEEARAARANPEIMNFMFSAGAEREIRNDANGVPRYVDTGEPVYQSDLSEGGGLFAGKGVDAQALNEGIRRGLWGEEEAINMATGRVVTNPFDQSQHFVGGGDLLQAPSGSSSSRGYMVPGEEQQPTMPGTQLTPGRSDQNTDTARTRRVQIANAQTALDVELRRYEKLVGANGLEVEPGPAKDQILAVRRSIQLQMKELLNLGVLNGPDLEILDQMLFDPSVNLTSTGRANIPGQLYSAVRGNAKERAKSSAAELRRIIKNMADSVLLQQDGRSDINDLYQQYGLEP